MPVSSLPPCPGTVTSHELVPIKTEGDGGSSRGASLPLPQSRSLKGQREGRGSKAVVLALRWVLPVLIAHQAEISLKGAVGVGQGGKSWVFGTSFSGAPAYLA